MAETVDEACVCILCGSNVNPPPHGADHPTTFVAVSPRVGRVWLKMKIFPAAR